MSLAPSPVDLLLPPPKSIEIRPRLRSPRLLVIEDDPSIIPLLTRALIQLDPDIVLDWACNADEGRSALASCDYDAVLADFMLADSESGLALYEDCQALQPDACFAMMSALPIRLPERRFRFLRKPFDVDDCRRFLADLFDETD